MYKSILFIIMLFVFNFSSCIIRSESNNNNSCIFDTDCEGDSFCNDNKCEKYIVCINSSECFDNENCIDNKCKKRHCMNDDECGKDEYCLEDFNCIHIPKIKVGESCLDYGSLECKSGNCIADEYRVFCTKNCETNNECPDSMLCGEYYDGLHYCLYSDTSEGDHLGVYGSNCSLHGDSDCIDIYKCVKNINNRKKDKCLNSCDSNIDCYDGYLCSFNNDNNSSFCLPPANKEEGELCNKFNGLECRNQDNNCIQITESYEKYCTKECLTDEDCHNNSLCKEFSSGKYCMLPRTADLGESCKNAGSEECKEGLICDMAYSRGALCTKPCESDSECPDYNSCTLTYTAERLCRPAINGLGNRNGTLGTSCYLHGDSDCEKDLLCLTSSLDDKNAFCTYHCNEDIDCEENYHCANTTKTSNKLCVKGNRGELGANCYNESCNTDLFCNINQSNDYTATCTRTCDLIGEACEKEGYYCNKLYDNFNICINKKPESEGNLGDKCPNGNCINGLNCIYDEMGNFCSQPCSNDNLCPDGFICNEYDENHSFCYIE